jgi:DNA primase
MIEIDVVRLLDEQSIDYNKKSKRATKNWVQLGCPFPDCFDTSDYMGVNIKSGVFHCWYCGRSGPLPVLLSKLMKISFRHAEAIIRDYESLDFSAPEEVQYAERVKVKGFMKQLPPEHKQYLASRGFDPDYVSNKYKIGAFTNWGRWTYRVGIPVYDNGMMVNMVARDITDLQERRYDALRNEEAVVGRRSCVYNIDNCKENGNILIVEGPIDVWRMGDQTVSLFGTAFSMSQVSRILDKFPKEVFIMFDTDDQNSTDNFAEKLAYCFAPFVKRTQVVNIGVKDPALLTPIEALEIKRELNL